MRVVVETPRLILRELAVEDADFLVRLLNDPDWLANIGDRGVRSVEDAIEYLYKWPFPMYEKQLGIWLIVRLEDQVKIGVCGLIKRDGLEDVDIGFALLPEYRGSGYAFEASEGAIRFGRETLGLNRIAGIVSPGNRASIRLLEKLGMRYVGPVVLPNNSEEVSLYRWEKAASHRSERSGIEKG